MAEDMEVSMRLLVLALTGVALLAGCKSNKSDSAFRDSGDDVLDVRGGTGRFNEPLTAPSVDPMVNTTPTFSAPASATNYTVQRGDTLWSIASRHYGNGQKWRDIVAANPGISETRLPAGRTIVLP
jgi:nucleoid-associated protein YgaU